MKINAMMEESRNSVKEISATDLREIANYKNPPSRIKLCMRGIFLLLKGKELEWKQIKQEMQKDDFIKSVLKLDPTKIKKSVLKKFQKEYIGHKDWVLKKF